MFRSIHIFLFCLLPWALLAQPYWVNDIGGAGNDHTADVKVDLDGSIYVTGEFSGTIDLGGQSYASSGSIDFFVARLTPTGTVTWFKQGGGNGVDRGRAIAIGANAVGISGEFMGSMSFEGNTISSSAGTTDMFVAVLNKIDGSVQWMKHGGGSAGADIAHSVAIASDGRVSIAGEFRGLASWDTSNLTSMYDPQIGQANSDIVIACYSAIGDLLWLQQGTATHADHAVDLQHGISGELYVTGQFSDTLTFDQAHPNILQNASFLVRFDALGNEIWFRSFGGAGYNNVNDLEWGADGELKVVGDLQGTMQFSGTTSVSITGSSTFSYYLLSIGSNGSLNDHTTIGSASGVTGRSIATTDTTLVVLGEFNCRFDALSDHYAAPGIFMATGNEDLFITEHDLSGMGILRAQQFAGRSAKVAGGLAILPAGDIVFCGSFQDNLFFSSEATFQADVSTSDGTLTGVIGNYDCGDSNYGTFAGSVSSGLTDGFIARGYVIGREPYDWWERTGAMCDRIPLEPCIREMGEALCSDTIVACGSATLEIKANYSYSNVPGANFLGPDLNYLWSDGSSTASMTVNNSGTFWVDITSTNGCWNWSDTIEVIILPAPPEPLLSDATGLNISTDEPQTLQLCEPQTEMVWATNATQSDSFWWSTPNSSVLIYSDSIEVDTTGTYSFVMANGDGCASVTSIYVVDYPVVELPDIELTGVFDLYQVNNDSVSFCDGYVIQYSFTPSFLINGVADSLPPELTLTWSYAPLPPVVQTSGTVAGTWEVMGSGWYTVQLNFMVTNEPCGNDSLIWTVSSDSLYVNILPAPFTEVDVNGPNMVCDGDSILMIATCTDCTAYEWYGPGITAISPDSVLISEPGYFSVTATATNQFGCTYADVEYFNVTMPTGIVINSTPPDGIICPGGTASIFANSTGMAPIWYGPNGEITDLDSVLTTDVPGEYYLTTDMGGCSMTSNSVMLTAYAAPYLETGSTDALCSPDDLVEIEVIAAPGAIIEWQPPLSGAAAIQIVGEVGTYTCLVTSCGISTSLSIDIQYSPITASIGTPGPYSICTGDTLMLVGATGAAEYLWLPSQTASQDLIVTEAGIFQLVMQNAEGCSDTASVNVTQVLFAQPLITSGDTICAGETAQLTAIGSGTITWFEDEDLTTILGNGSSLWIPSASSGSVYVQQTEAGCSGPGIQVDLVVIEIPFASIEGPALICSGDVLVLQATTEENADVQWSTPMGPFTGEQITIDNAASGNYIATPSAEGCIGSPASFAVSVVPPDQIPIPGSVILCTGDAITLTIPSTFSDIQWSDGSTGNELSVISGGTFSVNAIDPQGCISMANVVVAIEECGLEIPNVFSPNGDGVNDYLSSFTSTAGSICTIWDRWGGKVHEGDLSLRPWNGKEMNSGADCTEGVYYYEIDFTRANGERSTQSGYVHLQR